MLRRLKAAWFSFLHPDADKRELHQLVKEMYEWTRHKNTKWALRAKAALSVVRGTEMSRDYFEDIKGKRMSELTPEQKLKAHELWVRQNIGFFDDYHQQRLKGLLDVIDGQRACIENRSGNHG